MKKVSVKSMSDLKASHFLENSGQRLVRLYNGSPLDIINSLVPEDSPGDKLFSLTKKPNGFWVLI